ncbi:hypothetical protein N234_25655 [Ralstonia pickettii DTP0602]|nr:hypothetical protein N234_25655 [Ralstonia pickettii DTP0602]
MPGPLCGGRFDDNACTPGPAARIDFIGARARMKQFGNYQLDPDNRCVWLRGKRVALTPKAFSLLSLFVERSGQVIGHNELLDGVWRHQVVQPEVLKKYVMELRRALCHDGPGAPQIDNIPRVGYLFTAPTAPQDAVDAAHAAASLLIGRDDSLATLRDALARARVGTPGIVLVCGEAGVGKSALLRAFFEESRRMEGTLCAWSCCTEQNESDALLPFLDMVQQLWSDAHSAPRAPVAAADPGSGIPLKLTLASRLGYLAGYQTIVLFIDDVHWADPSSVELLAHLSAQAQPRKLLVVCAYRASELQRLRHPFHELQLQLRAHGHSLDCRLDALAPTAMRTYINLLMPRNSFAPAFYDLVAAKTEGNPLFLNDLIAYLREHRHLREVDGYWSHPADLDGLRDLVPASSTSMVDLKVRLLDEDDRHLLLAASLQGSQFDTLVVARAMQKDAVIVEERMVSLANLHALIAPVAEVAFPAGSVSLRFMFSHALYRDALLRLHGPARRALVARHVAEAMEWAYAAGAHDMHSQIAALYLLARDHQRAAQNFLSAARANAALFANREAFDLAQRGLEALRHSPVTQGLEPLETDLQLLVGATQSTLVDWPNAMADAAYRRAEELSRASRDRRAMIGSLYGAWNGLRIRGDLVGAQPLARRLLEAVTEECGWSELLARQSNAMTDLFMGRYHSALRHGRAGLRSSSPDLDREIVEQFQRSAVASLYSTSALAAWSMGWTCYAASWSQRGLDVSLALQHPASIASSLGFCAFLSALRDLPAETLAIKARFDDLRDDEALSNWRAIFRCLAGWSRYRLDGESQGITEMTAGLDDLERTGVRLGRTYLQCLLAQALLNVRSTQEAMALARQALQASHRSGDVHGAPELARVLAEAHAQRGEWPDAQLRYQEAIDLTSHQGALVFQARALESAARLPHSLDHAAAWQTRRPCIERRLRTKHQKESTHAQQPLARTAG